MFLHVEPSSSFADIKKRIAANFNMDSSAIMLVANDKVSTTPKYPILKPLPLLYIVSTSRLTSLLHSTDDSSSAAVVTCCCKHSY